MRRHFARGRIRTGGQNKTELAYQNYLELLRRAGEVAWFRFEGMKFKLADKTYYTPDFVVMTKDGNLEAHEVKGFWEDDARVKIKVAAEMFPLRFVAIKHVKGEWIPEEF